VLETLVDGLAMRAHADPIAYRLRLLQREALRLRGALELLDRVSDWRCRLPRGHAAGIACVEYEGTAVALALDVTLEKTGAPEGDLAAAVAKRMKPSAPGSNSVTSSRSNS
jgi:hypothetical protein